MREDKNKELLRKICRKPDGKIASPKDIYNETTYVWNLEISALNKTEQNDSISISPNFQDSAQIKTLGRSFQSL